VDDHDQNVWWFLAALKALLDTYEEDGMVSVPIHKLKTLLHHYDLP
jgi:hypothetical protein